MQDFKEIDDKKLTNYGFADDYKIYRLKTYSNSNYYNTGYQLIDIDYDEWSQSPESFFFY